MRAKIELNIYQTPSGETRKRKGKSISIHICSTVYARIYIQHKDAKHTFILIYIYYAYQIKEHGQAIYTRSSHGLVATVKTAAITWVRVAAVVATVFVRVTVQILRFVDAILN